MAQSEAHFGVDNLQIHATTDYTDIAYVSFPPGVMPCHPSHDWTKSLQTLTDVLNDWTKSCPVLTIGRVGPPQNNYVILPGAIIPGRTFVGETASKPCFGSEACFDSRD